ncbi:MAG TPA: hypothetical protein VFD89_03325, partial [Clostridia bacterium]|nr:hypothetical protein [Clostridia bacterium]
ASAPYAKATLSFSRLPAGANSSGVLKDITFSPYNNKTSRQDVSRLYKRRVHISKNRRWV